MTATIETHAPVDTLFRNGHTTYRFTDEPVTDEELRTVYDMVKYGPTAMNGQPLRITFLRSTGEKARLLPHLDEGNRAKSESAPVVAILAYDPNFHDHLPEMFPQFPAAKAMFADEESRHGYSALNSALQAGYFLIAARAAGLDVGPMGGFNSNDVDKEFHADNGWRSFLIVNMGHTATDGQFPRNPRLPFETAARTL